jgi:excisionase family DNA binding protein
MDKYYTVDQISSMLDLHEKTVQRYIREGKLKASKVGKSWRINGHDLSVFVEQTAPIAVSPSSGERAAMQQRTATAAAFNQTAQPTDRNREKIRISAVVDIDVADKDEASRIINMMLAILNCKPADYGQTSMNAQYLEFEQKVRIMLWGQPRFMEDIIHSIAAFDGHESD